MVESVECLKEERVPEKLWEAEGRSREDTDVGNEGPAAMVLWGRDIILHIHCFPISKSKSSINHA